MKFPSKQELLDGYPGTSETRVLVIGDGDFYVSLILPDGWDGVTDSDKWENYIKPALSQLTAERSAA